MAVTVNNCDEAYALINDRQITALMFHDEMASVFDFLNLKGFKKMHEYQYLSESVEHRKTQNCYMKNHHSLIKVGELTPEWVIPTEWYKYTKTDVTTAVRKQYIQKAFEHYREWESDTRDLYEELAKDLLDWGCIADFQMMNELLCDVSCELSTLMEIYLEIKSVDYDPSYIQGMQECYAKKYCHKIQDVGEQLYS